MKKTRIYLALTVLFLTAAACAKQKDTGQTVEEPSIAAELKNDDENLFGPQVLKDSLTGYYARSAKSLDNGLITMDFFIFREQDRYYGYLNMMGFENESDWYYPQAVMLVELLEEQGIVEARYVQSLEEVPLEEYWGTYREGDLLFLLESGEDTLEVTWEKLAVREKNETKKNGFVREERFLSVILSGERDKDVFLRAAGISKEAAPIYRYGGTRPLIVYYDEQTGKGLGLYYMEEYIVGFDIPECEREEWQDKRYDVTKDGADGSGTENYQENREYNDNGQMTRFEARGMVDGPGEPHEDTLIQIDYSYRGDGTLERKECYYNWYVFGTYRSNEIYYYDEKGRPEYAYAYVSHGSMEEFYIYGDDGDVPSYCLTVDHFGADACTESFIHYGNN